METSSIQPLFIPAGTDTQCQRCGARGKTEVDYMKFTDDFVVCDSCADSFDDWADEEL